MSIEINKLAGLGLMPGIGAASCPLSVSHVCASGSGVSGVVATRPAAVIRERISERPAQAPAVAEAAAPVYAFAAHGANQLFGQQKTQLFPMWALRGLDPWSEPT